MQGTTHIIGAGIAGLCAATKLAAQGNHVAVYEAAPQAGGRCRSYHDEAFGIVIDNGNHLLLSGNKAALTYLKRIGSDIHPEAKEPAFDFIDAKTMQRWKLRLNKGRFPWWLMSRNRRVPGTGIADYLSILRLLGAKQEQLAGPLLDTGTLLYQRLWHPLLLAALNTDPAQGSAQLAEAIVRGTLLKGGNACIPIVADGLSSLFIDPALRYLNARGMDIMFNRRVNKIHFENHRAAKLECNDAVVALAPFDSVICSVPAWTASTLLPGIKTPDEYRAILNAHFRIAPSPAQPAILGVINATTEWIFAFPGRISVTVSNADRLMQEERGILAKQIWQEISDITGLARELPPWQIVKEKRATFAATPAEDAKRPHTLTAWSNVYLAGDYVQTGLPATIESAVLSGERAAELMMEKL